MQEPMSQKATVPIELTKSQCQNLAELIDVYFFQTIRDDPDVDNMAWVRDLVDAYDAFMMIADKPDGEVRHRPWGGASE